MKRKLLFLAMLFLITALSINSARSQGNALIFDGTDDYAELGTGLSSLFDNAFTCEVWIKKTTAGSQTIMGTMIEGGLYQGFDVAVDGANKITVHLNNNLGNYIQVTSSTILTNGTWYHIAVTYDGSKNANNINIYINGILDAKTVNNSNLTSSVNNFGQFVLGRRVGGPYWYNGSMDEIRIWNTVRTPAQILANMDNELIGNELGLVSYYNFNSSSGTTLFDIASTNNGNLINGPTWVASTIPLESSITPPGNCLTFDGTNDFVNLGNNASFQFGTGSFTLEAWVKSTSTGTNNIITKSGSGNQMFFDIVGGAGYFEVQGVAIVGTTTINDGKWHHLAAVKSGTNAELYVDGVLEGSGTMPGTVPADGDLVIATNSAIVFFTGSIDEVRIWNIALDLTAIQTNIYSELTGGEAGLVSYYNFNQPSGTTLLDIAGTKNGTLINMAGTEWSESYALVAPAPAAATSVTSSGFTANWTAPVTGTVETYKLDVATNNTFTTGLTSFDIATPTLTKAVTGLSASTQYFYRVRAYKASVGDVGTWHYSNPKSVTTTGSPTWSGTAWVPSAPTASDDAIINGNYSGAGFIAKNLTVNNGFTLNIAANQTVTVEGALVNNGTIWLKSQDGQPTGALLNKGTLTNNGSMKAEKFLSTPHPVPTNNTMDGNWHFLGSPMTTGIPVESILLNDYVYRYTRVSPFWDDLAYGSDNIEPQTGYLVQNMLEDGKTITLSGTFATGTVNYTLATNGDKWNLVANPFPTPIDLNDVAITGAADYFYLWDLLGGNYVSYQKSINDGFRFVPNMTGFFVGATGATKIDVSTIGFTDAVKESNSVFRKLKKSETNNHIHFTVNNAKGQKDNVYVVLTDIEAKAPKMFSLINTAPQAYIVENDENISIKSYPESTEERIIPIAFESQADGNYTFNIEDFTITDKAYLRDLHTGAWISLSANTVYEFTHNASNDKLRFELVLNPKTTGVENPESPMASIYSNQEMIYVTLAYAENTTISVFDLSGRKLQQVETNEQNNQLTGFVSGVYLVKVENAKGTQTTKVFVK